MDLTPDPVRRLLELAAENEALRRRVHSLQRLLLEKCSECRATDLANAELMQQIAMYCGDARPLFTAIRLH